MPRQSVFDMKVSKVYPLLVAKAEKKGRTKAEVDEVTAWLTGYDMETTDLDVTYAEFFDNAPAYNPRAELITGKICGIQVETIEDPSLKHSINGPPERRVKQTDHHKDGHAS